MGGSRWALPGGSAAARSPMAPHERGAVGAGPALRAPAARRQPRRRQPLTLTTS